MTTVVKASSSPVDDEVRQTMDRIRELQGHTPQNAENLETDDSRNSTNDVLAEEDLYQNAFRTTPLLPPPVHARYV